jgi:protein phosphatase 1 regulatory subunit 7
MKIDKIGIFFYIENIFITIFQIETTGVRALETLEEMEILFLSCDEISSLNNCRSLRKLTMLDNGLKLISNLAPVSMTLTSLCLCDQEITKMDHLDLPVLRELFLHRNSIAEISDLGGCPRLRKLWLFQNKISSLKGLYSAPLLEECWLQVITPH